MKSRNDFNSEEEYRDYLRAYFAGQALTGLLANPEYRKKDGFAAHDVVGLGEAMVTELFHEVIL